MVKKINCVKIKKPVLRVQGQDILMDRHWHEHTINHLNEIAKDMPIKAVHNKSNHLLVEFKNAKIATMFRLKYGEERKQEIF